jgi:cell division protein ZapA
LNKWIFSAKETDLVQPIKVRILDHEYLIKSKEDEEQVHRIAEYVNDKLKEVKDNTEGLSEKKTAILAALNIASEYFQLLKEQDDLLARLRQRTESLIHNIDSVIG